MRVVGTSLQVTSDLGAQSIEGVATLAGTATSARATLVDSSIHLDNTATLNLSGNAVGLSQDPGTVIFATTTPVDVSAAGTADRTQPAGCCLH
jgi:hypothetical protein